MFEIFLINLLSGALLTALAVPLWLEKIPPNGIYGFRVPATLEDPVRWYAVNKYGARYLAAAGLADILAAVVLYFVPGLSVDAYALLCLGVFLIIFVPGIVQTVRYLRSLD